VKLGILETDHLDKTIQKKYGTYAEMFQKLFLPLMDQLVIQVYDVMHFEYPDTIDDCDAYLITGSKTSPYENKAWIRRLEEEIQTLHIHKKKLIGICFGHQLIAQALGGVVKKSDLGWGVGLSKQNILRKKNWMGHTEAVFQVLVSHQDQVIELPPGAEAIAGNAFCPNASFQIDQHILTLQGHPEFSPAYLRHLITGRRAIIGTSRAEQALQSLHASNDHAKIARWILDFLKAN